MKIYAVFYCDNEGYAFLKAIRERYSVAAQFVRNRDPNAEIQYACTGSQRIHRVGVIEKWQHPDCKILGVWSVGPWKGHEALWIVEEWNTDGNINNGNPENFKQESNDRA